MAEIKRRRGRPRGPGYGKKQRSVDLSSPPLMLLYLDDVAEMQTYGTNRNEVARNFILNEINRLIENGRLKERASDDA